MSKVIVTGQNGTLSSPAGGSALARNTGSSDSANTAVARGGMGSNLTHRYDHTGGYANAIASTVANSTSELSAIVSAIGGAGGYNSGVYGFVTNNGGNAAGYADASDSSLAITNVSALAVLQGGKGGAVIPDANGGNGGIVLSPSGANAAAFGAFAANAGAGVATATVHATGGAGAATHYRTGGAGGSVSLVNAARGRTNGGTLNLTQDATGGAGGASIGYTPFNGYYAYGTGGTGGTGGNASSVLSVTDHSSAGISLNVAATGGNGGAGLNQADYGASGGNSGNGGTAAARGSASGIGNVSVVVTATGGSSAYDTYNSGVAAQANASAVAITTGLTQKATAVANDIGGAGGIGGGHMFAFGTSGIGANAYGATACASSIGGNASATATATGGTGGFSNFGGNGSGGNAALVNAVSASSVTGGITLIQTATGGEAGVNGSYRFTSSGNGGAAYSSLTTTTSTTGAVVAKVSATGGNAGYGNPVPPNTYNGGDATAQLHITARGNIITNVTAFGGNNAEGGATSLSGNATADGVAISSGGSGSVISNSTAIAGLETYGEYAASNATSVADASHSTGTATAVSTAGAPQGGQYFNDTTANSSASAITSNGKAAIARAAGYGGPGPGGTSQADATAATSEGIIEKLAAAAAAPVSVGGTAQAEADGGTAFNSGMGTDDSYAFAGGLAAFPTLGPNVKTVFHAAGARDFGNGTLGYNADPNALSPQTYTSSVTWDLNQSTLTGDTLDLGLITANAKGDNFATLTLQVSVQGSTVIDKTFTSPSQASTYFSDNALNLGSIAGGANPLAVTVSLSATPTDDVNDGFGFSFMLGATKPASDHVAVARGLTGFEPRMEFVAPAASVAAAIPAPSVADLFADSATSAGASLAGGATPVIADTSQALTGFGAMLTGDSTLTTPLGAATKLVSHGA